SSALLRQTEQVRQADLAHLAKSGRAGVMGVVSFNPKIQVVAMRYLEENHLDQHLGFGAIQVGDHLGDIGISVIVGYHEDLAGIRVDRDSHRSRHGAIGIIACGTGATRAGAAGEGGKAAIVPTESAATESATPAAPAAESLLRENRRCAP